MNTIDKFIDELKSYKNNSKVSNPYWVEGVAANLKKYLEIMLTIKGKRVLLVGEAPGYRGCKITGIPFTSGNVIENVEHPVLMRLRGRMLLSEIKSENTATVVWNYLATKTNTPLFWNSFPFHPHYSENQNTNRAPSNDEIKYGVRYLRILHELFKPEQIAGIGQKGFKCAQQAFPDIATKYIRHPSYGGKLDFIKGMDEIL